MSSGFRFILMPFADQAQYQMHLAEMEAVRAGMPVVCVNHSGNEGSAIRDIHMENFSVSVGGRDLITDASVTLSFGRHYGQFLIHTTCSYSSCIFFHLMIDGT